MTNVLSGYKTYIVSVGIVMVAVGSFLSGDATLQDAVVSALTGLGIGTLRAGVKKTEV